MPTLLVIADLGHASPRFPGICQELGRMGWEIDLITPRMNDYQKNCFLFNESRTWNLIETPYYLMRYKRYANSTIPKKALIKLLFELTNAFRQIQRRVAHISQEDFGFSDHAAWEKHVNRVLFKLADSKKYDLVLSSSSPFTAHMVGRNIASNLDVPWVADYRDLYSLNHTNPLNVSSVDFEASIIESASALITVSAGFAKSQREIYSGEIIVVNNGFKELKPRKEIIIDGPVKILYSGTIENGFQNLELFLDSLEELNSSQIKAEVTFLGSSCSDVRRFYSDNSQRLPKFIHLNGNVSREESLSQQRSSDLLLYFEWGNPEIDGVLLTKLYEYIASGSAILRVGAAINDEAAGIFKNIGYPASLSTKKQIVDWLSEVIHRKTISTIRNDVAASYFSYASIASRLDKDLRRLIGESSAKKKVGV
jgi:hypothetical protein